MVNFKFNCNIEIQYAKLVCLVDTVLYTYCLHCFCAPKCLLVFLFLLLGSMKSTTECDENVSYFACLQCGKLINTGKKGNNMESAIRMLNI